MEITVVTEKYDAQELQNEINTISGSIACVVLGGDIPHEFIVVVANETVGNIVKGVLKHVGVRLSEVTEGEVV